MVGASKILTVSYGTFSCTLEGFDDSFDTMKAIAEYFRDLASEDRYFGAEPSAPEPEMLQKIAEREALRRVETRMDDNGIHLRASDSATQAAPEPVAVQPQAAPAPEPQAAPVAPAAPPFFFDTQAEPARRTDIDSFEDEGDLGSVAARLARIRDVVDAPNPVVEGAQPAAPQEPVQAPQEIKPAEADTAEAAEPFEATAPLETAEPFETSDVLADAVDNAPEEDQDDTAGLVADAIFDSPEDIEIDTMADAEDLQASEDEAVTGDVEDATEFTDFNLGEETAVEVAAYDEEIEEDSTPETQELDLEALAQSLAIGEDAPIAEEETESAADNADIDLTSLNLSTTADDAIEDDVDAENAEIDEFAQEEADTPMQLTGDMVIAEQSGVEGLEESAEPADEARLPSEATNQALARARARVLKVKRDDNVAGADENMQTDEEPTDAAATESQGSESSLKLGRPIRPQREKPAAQPEAEVTEHAPQAEIEAQAQPETLTDESVATDDAPTAAKLADSADEPDESMSRLVDEVNTKMDEQEHKRRRSAIAHLKAAVAATMADRRSRKEPSEDEIDETDSQPYREDLEQAVRPKPAALEAQAAPLMLVSEQRIDDTPEPEEPRQNATMMSVGSLAVQVEEETAPIVLEDESFEQFAQRVGAKELPELLEAAGAYQLMVNDEPHFTRPHVMNAAAQFLGRDSFAREDGLRAFGSLLREGPIKRVKKGRFTLSKNSRFMC